MNARICMILVTFLAACADEMPASSTTTATTDRSESYGTLTSAPQEIKEESPIPQEKDKCLDVVCDDKVDCTKDTCNPETGACQHESVDALCGEGQKCLASPEGNVAEAGCVACTVNADCDDNNACTADTCGLFGKCYNDVQGCADGNSCTEDVCDPAIGCTYMPKGNFVPCDDDGNNKTVDQCVNNVCEHNKYWGVRIKAPISPLADYYTQVAITYPIFKNGKVESVAWSTTDKTGGAVKNGYLETDAFATTSGDCNDCICAAYETMSYPVMFTGLYLSNEKNESGFSAKQLKIPAHELKVFAVYNQGHPTEFEVELTTEAPSESLDTLPWKLKEDVVMTPMLEELCDKE